MDDYIILALLILMVVVPLGGIISMYITMKDNADQESDE